MLWHLIRRGRQYDVVHTASFPYFSLLAAAATLVSTTGTTTSAQERGPRERQPRMRWASLTSVKDATTVGTRFIDAAIVVPVLEKARGSASITSYGWSSREKGAAAKMAAAIVIPPDAPNARASTV